MKKTNLSFKCLLYIGVLLLMMYPVSSLIFVGSAAGSELERRTNEAVEAGVGGAAVYSGGKLVRHADGSGVPASEVNPYKINYGAGYTSEYFDNYYVYDDSGQLITVRQWNEQIGMPTSNTPKGSSGASAATPACEHEYTSEVTKQPTCVEPGETTYTCSKCGHTYTEEIPATGEHDFEVTTDKEATCTETGLATKVCKVCGHTETVTLPAIGHDYEEAITKEPTCTEPGVKTFTCKNCGDTYTEEIPALGHEESEWVVVKEPGWFTPGLKQTTCTRCGEVLNSEEIPQMYPMWYLFAGIGVVAVVIALVVFLLTRKRKKI